MRRAWRLIPASLVALLAMSAPPTMAREISGEVRFSGQGGGQADARHAIVYFEPDAPRAVTGPRAPTEGVMSTRNKAFEPLVLPVPKGGSVRFPNHDPILHNVFSVSPGNAFDLGLYSRGPGESRRFEEPGVVRVFCNVHHAMIGYVLVLETPHHVSPDSRGRFRLTELPEGSGRLVVWHPQSEEREVKIAHGFSGSVEVLLEVTRRLVPPHLNKFGKSYKRGRRGRYD